MAATHPIEAKADGPNFTLQVMDAPSGTPYFEFDVTPGDSVNGTVRVANEGDTAGTVWLFGVDAVTGATTGAVYQESSEPRRSVGAWLSLSEGEFHLRPGQSRAVDFEVRVPRDAGAGHRLGGIVAENATLEEAGRQEAGGGSFEVDLRNLTILAVQINLPGEREELLELIDVEPGPAEGFQTLLLGMKNEGNQILKGKGTALIRSEGGEALKRHNFNMDTFVPGTEIEYPLVVPGEALPAGRYHADIKVRYGNGELAHLATWFNISDGQIEQVFGSTPQEGPGGSSNLLRLLAGALILLILAAVLAWALWRRRYGSEVLPSPTYVTGVHMPEGSEHDEIVAIQWQNPGTLAFGQSTRDAVVEWINAGGDLRVRDQAGREFSVGIVYGYPSHLHTYSGDSWTDNLLHLPRF